MPICEADPWRMQYFEHVACPADVLISTEDADSWIWYPRWRWIYDKVAVALSQGLEAAPHGVEPKSFPVFSKPITNLKGMGVGSRVLRSAADYVDALRARPHVDDAARRAATCRPTWRCSTGIRSGGATRPANRAWKARSTTGRFTPRHDSAIEQHCGAWIEKHFAGYTGMLNLETIGGRIIEAHLRFADQWPDLYGKGWVAALVRLYEHQRWDYPDARPPRRLQRGAVRPARPTLSPSAASAGRRGACDALRLERADHVSRGQAARLSTRCRRAGFGWPL